MSNITTTQSNQIQTRGLAALFRQVAESNQTLANQQQGTALAAQQSMNQVNATVQALTRENGALKAEIALIKTTNTQQLANFERQLNEMRTLMASQNQATQALTNRTTTIETTQTQIVQQVSQKSFTAYDMMIQYGLCANK